MATSRIVGVTPSVIVQSMNSGIAFDGAYPGADSVDNGKGQYIYPAQASHGGLFFWNCNEPILVTQFYLDCRGSSANISLSIVTLDLSVPASPAVVAGSAIALQKYSASSGFSLYEASFKALLMPGQGLQLITSAVAAQVQIAQAAATLERSAVR